MWWNDEIKAAVRRKEATWKERSNAKGGKVENCGRIKDRNGRLA